LDDHDCRSFRKAHRFVHQGLPRPAESFAIRGEFGQYAGNRPCEIRMDNWALPLDFCALRLHVVAVR